MAAAKAGIWDTPPTEAEMAAAKVPTPPVEAASVEAPAEPESGIMDALRSIAQSAGAVGRGAAQGITGGFADELQGGIEALLGGASKLPIAERYRRGRDESRAAFKAAEEANPTEYMIGDVGGSLAASAVPFGAAARGASLAAKGATAAGRVGRALGAGAGLGALGSVGASEADTTKELLKDMAIGAGIGTGAGALGGATGELGRWVGSKGRTIVENAEKKIAELAEKKQAKLIASLKGALGGESQKASRLEENLRRTMNDRDLNPALRQEARALLASPEGVRLRERVMRNTMRDAPGQEAAVEAAEDALREAAEAGEKNIADDIARGRSLGETYRTQVAPRFATMGSRFIPPLIGSVLGSGGGALLGGEGNRGIGSGVGGTLGTLAGITLGNPTIVMRNMVRAPSVQRAVGLGLERKLAPLLSSGVTPSVLGAGTPLARWLVPTEETEPDEELAP